MQTCIFNYKLNEMKKVFVAALALVCAAAVTSCGSKSLVTKGSSSKMDSLSYCLGANIGYGVKMEMGDIPFNNEMVKKGITEGALEKSKQTQDEAIELLRDYFMNKRQARRAAINELLAADSTLTPDYTTMFATDGECDSLSYAFGNDIGNNVRASNIPLQTRWIVKGYEEAYNGESAIDEMGIQKYLQNYFMVVRPKLAAEKSAKWLEKLSHKSGVEKTESGLLYKVVREGDMSLAATDDRDVVVVNYEGKTMDGNVFDSSYERGEPAEFPLNRVISGWTEGMKLVGVGGEIILYIPSSMAYGERGAGRDIGPNEALEFKVELIEVKPYVDPNAAPAEEAAETTEAVETPAAE